MEGGYRRFGVSVATTAHGWRVLLTPGGVRPSPTERLRVLADRALQLDAALARVLAKGKAVTIHVQRDDFAIPRVPRTGGVFNSADLIRPLLMRRKVDDALYPYQRSGVAWLLRHRRALLADDMGLGKTAQAIGATRRLVRQGVVRWGLVVVPRTLVANWHAECRTWAPELCVNSQLPVGKHRDEIWYRAVQRAHLVITTYEQLRDPPAALLDTPPDLVIADEAHRLRRRESLSNRGFSTISTDWLWALSGTPLERDAEDLAVLMSILDPRRFSSEDGRLHPATLRARARPYILRRRRDDVLGELPPIMENEEELELTSAQRGAYVRAIRTHAQRNRPSSFLALFGELRSICDMESNSRSSAKLDRILDLIADTTANDEKAVVFSYLLPPLYELRERLRNAGVGCEILTGEMGLSERSCALDRFRTDPRSHVLLASSRVASEGLTLTEANHVFFVNRWWNPSSNAQARDRVVRIGQTRAVCVWNFSCRGTVESRLGSILATKQQTFDQLIDALRQSDISQYSELFSEP